MMLIVFILILLTFKMVSICRLMILSWNVDDSFVVYVRYCLLVIWGFIDSCQMIIVNPRGALPHDNNPHPNFYVFSYTCPLLLPTYSCHP